jgi:hypothetical protein
VPTGHVAEMRIPTACCANSSPRAPTLGTISQTKLNYVNRLMNQRPRKTLGWKTPQEGKAEVFAAFTSHAEYECNEIFYLIRLKSIIKTSNSTSIEIELKILTS